MKCKRHPSYQGKREPTSKCGDCRRIFESAHALELKRKEQERQEEQRNLEKALREAIGQIKDFEKHVEAIKALKDAHRTFPIEPREKSGTSEATAIATATDWHFGSRVKPSQVNDHNEFNVAIAKQRIGTFFERVARLVRKEQQDVKIKNLILFLGGDLINGSLHLDTAMSDEIAQPIEQAVECQALIESGLNYLLNNANVEHITIPCCDGNHGRITSKQQWTSRQGNALEYYMYYNLAKRFPMIDWVFAPGLLIYQKVYEWNIRFHHGD